MAHWKYHIQSGDAVVFKWEYNGNTHKAVGTVSGLILPPDFPDEPEFDDFDFNEIDVRIQSGQEEVTVPLSKLTSRTKKEDRETELPKLSERMRFTGNTVRRIKRKYGDDQ
jgi:hypothetical protein